MAMQRRTAVLAAGVMALLGCAGLAAAQEKGEAAAKVAPAGEKVDLTPRYKAGQTIRLSQHTWRKDVTSFKSGDQAMTGDMVIDQTVHYLVRVEEVSEASTVIAMEITQIAMKAELPQGKFEWDSTSPPDDKDLSNPVVLAFKPLLGTVTRVLLGKDGRVVEVKPDSNLTAPPRGALQPFVTQVVGSDQVRMRWGSILWVHPGSEPVAVGGTWTTSDSLNATTIGAKFVFETTGTLKGAKDGLADIDLAGKITLLPLEKDKEPVGSMSEPRASGAVVWDTKAGFVKSHTWKQAYTLNVNAQGMPVVRSIDTVTETKVVEEKK